MTRAAQKSDNRAPLRDGLNLDPEGVVSGTRAVVPGDESTSVLPGGRPNKSVVDGTAGDPEPRTLLAEGGSLPFAKKSRCRKVASQDLERIDGRATQARW